nr:MAG TPA: hypothetical protein [Caudoviricetes sp.]
MNLIAINYKFKNALISWCGRRDLTYFTAPLLCFCTAIPLMGQLWGKHFFELYNIKLL